MSGQLLVAADARIEEAAASVLNGDNVAFRVPMCALQKGRQVDAADGRRRFICMGRHERRWNEQDGRLVHADGRIEVVETSRDWLTPDLARTPQLVPFRSGRPDPRFAKTSTRAKPDPGSDQKQKNDVLLPQLKLYALFLRRHISAPRPKSRGNSVLCFFPSIPLKRKQAWTL